MAHFTKQLSPVLVMFCGEPAHYCPGCKELHRFAVSAPQRNGAQWSFDGNVDKPTFQPSMNIVGYCHYFLHAGRIQFLNDCRHALAGQTVDLPPLPAWCIEEGDDGLEPDDFG